MSWHCGKRNWSRGMEDSARVRRQGLKKVSRDNRDWGKRAWSQDMTDSDG
jgi:hypothetical protein